ncbi:MAG: type II secretion system F family protein [Betaproteobacteria bacterium]|jgi:tight adherence protein C|nr:type II secretion system F family protein [Betaproteobacteria bacterium]
MMILYGGIVFCVVTLVSLSLIRWFLPDASQRRVQDLGEPGARTDWIPTVVRLAGPLAKLSIPSGPWESSPQRIKFLNAGIRSQNAPVLFYAAKTLLPLVFAVATFSMLDGSGQGFEENSRLFLILVSAMVGCFVPNLCLHLAVSSRKREIFEHFPDTADLLLVCVEAGLGLEAALVRVAEEMRIHSIAMMEEIHLLNLETRAGNSREKALRNLSLRTGVEEVNAFAMMLSQTDKFGTSLGQSLRVFAEELRNKRQNQAEEAAAKIPTKMLFPLVLCIFPAISMVVLGPAGIRTYHMILPMLSGQN